LKENLARFFDGHSSTQHEIDVVEGNILFELLKHIKRKQIDLVLIGKKMGKTHSSKLAEKLCRKAPCSVLIIPENAKIQLSGILVPIDFSDNSADAMDIALSFGSAAGLEKIDCVNVFKLPIGYYKTGKTEAQFTEIVKKNAKKTYQDFIQKIDKRGVQVNDIYTFSSDTIEGIEHTISMNPYDLIVLGAQGRRAGAAILLGSVTEQLIWSATIPILAAKQKGAGMNLLDAILQL
jgi:nucleotide-binding universal stress UspA family protein